MDFNPHFLKNLKKRLTLVEIAFIMKHFFTLLISVIFLSCGGNTCDHLDCGLNGTCDENSETCLCDEFYEGALCDIEVRAKFLGNWSGTGECSNGGTFPIDIEISQGVDIDVIKLQSEDILQNFTITGQLNGDNQIDIDQFMTNISSAVFNGDIFEDSGSLNITLTADVNGMFSLCSYTVNK